MLACPWSLKGTVPGARLPGLRAAARLGIRAKVCKTLACQLCAKKQRVLPNTRVSFLESARTADTVHRCNSHVSAAINSASILAMARLKDLNVIGIGLQALSGSFLGREGPQKSTPYPDLNLATDKKKSSQLFRF